MSDVEAVRFARREACRDVVAELEAALAACRAERDRLTGEVKTLIWQVEKGTDESAQLTADLDAARDRERRLRGALDAVHRHVTFDYRVQGFRFCGEVIAQDSPLQALLVAVAEGEGER